MTCAGIQMFMEKLNQLINCHDVPLINNPIIIEERPQFKLLYEELGSMIETLFIHEHQDLPELDDLKKRFTDAAEEAEYIVDLFLSRVHTRNNEHQELPELERVDDLNNKSFRYATQYIVNLFLFCFCFHKCNDERLAISEGSLNLDDVGRSFECIQVEMNNEHLAASSEGSLNLDDVRSSLESIKVDYRSMRTDNMYMDSSEKTRKNQSAAAPAPRNSRGPKLDEIMVGIDDDAELIRDKLVEDQKKLDVVSIVGMGGLGKTTLATKVYNDRFIMHHFHLRMWVNVSQTYDKRGVLLQILESICVQLHLENATDSRLRELVHKHLIGKRYLVVIDDIWHIETWDQVNIFFPHDNSGSRILLTSRLIEVAKHANSNGLIHHLGYLNEERSCELLCRKVFRGINKFPEWSIKYGMKIVKNCKGLPLSVVVIAGILAKEAWKRKLWKEIAKRTGSYIVGDQNGCLEILALSYHHLPLHLRDCFLYLGGFPEDHYFSVRELIWLWVAEGFIQQEGSKSLENIAESYLMDLIDRNLVIVSNISETNGAIRACRLHDIVRELCLRKAEEEGFNLKIQSLVFSSPISNAVAPPCKSLRMFIKEDINISIMSTQNLRSVLSFGGSIGPLTYDMSYDMSYDTAKYLCSFTLLRVLDLRRYDLRDFPNNMEFLVHLRYLAIRKSSSGFPSSICNLWGLQTLIYITNQVGIVLPRNISDLVNLKHLWNHDRKPFYLPSIEKPMNLQAISDVKLGDEVGNFQNCFPNIKTLKCDTYRDEECDFESLTCLKKLILTDNRITKMKRITLPATLAELTLIDCQLPWSRMSVIQSLPNLQVLILGYKSFVGSCWNTYEQEFRQLTFLELRVLDIKQWEAYSTSFPCLRKLEIDNCHLLKEIPLEIGDIPTLELIRVDDCSDSVNESVRMIQEEQKDLGNYDLKIKIKTLR